MAIVIPRKGLSRRTVLRGMVGGVAATVGLPVLDAMLDDTGGALAQGAPLPTRFGLWFWGNGIRREHWIPDGIGAGWRPREELAPLVDAGLRPWLSVISGLEIKTANHPHHSGMTGILTGARYHQVGVTRDTIVSTFAHPSVDQIAADLIAAQQPGGADRPYRSLEAAVCRFRGTDEGTTFQHLSHNGPNDVNPSEYAPRRMYDRLFGQGPGGPQIDLARRSVLDAVTGRIRGLQQTVGARDARRLERHFESVRAIERRLAAAPAECRVPDRPGDFPDLEGREQIAEKNAAQSALMAYALACDFTRAFSVMFSCAGSGVVVWPAGARNSLHQICHDEPNPQPTVHAAVVFIMQQLAVFLRTLADMPEGDGNLLDRCSILCTTELSEGNTHSNDEFPVLIAGRGGGRLRGDMHVRTDRANASLAALSALRGAGLDAPSFGHDAGRVVDDLGALFA